MQGWCCILLLLAPPTRLAYGAAAMRRDGDFGIYTEERFERGYRTVDKVESGQPGRESWKKMVGSKGNMDESERNRACDSGSKVGQAGLVWLLQWVAGGSPTKATVPSTSLPRILIPPPPLPPCWGVAKESGYVECFKARHTDAPLPAIEPDWERVIMSPLISHSHTDSPVNFEPC